MYWQAHHLFDCLTGVALTLPICLLLELLLGGALNTLWWHPVCAVVILIILVKALGTVPAPHAAGEKGYKKP